MIVLISTSFSRGMVMPLAFFMYLLTADCVIPRIFAACVSVILCFSRRVFVRRARIEGDTVLTATSQGVIIITPVMACLWANLYKDAVCHEYMTYVRTGSSS